MKNLLHFKNAQLSKKDLENLKGGLRFLTYNQSEYNQVRSKLQAYGINYSHGSTNEAHGRTHYCIEW